MKMKKSMLFKDDIRSFFIDITDYHTGFGPVIDFDWQGDDAVEIKPKDEKMMYNTAFKNMFEEAVESVKKYIERHPDYSITYYDENRCIVCISEGNVVKSTKKMKKSSYRKTKNVSKSDISALFDDLEDAVYDWDEGWIDNVMDANYAQAHGEPEEACRYLEDMYDNCHNSRVASLCERIFDRLGCSQYIASTKKSKNIKKYDNGFTHSELQSLCPHATRIWDEMSIDVIWDLPSGNHPGIFISDHGPLDAPVYVCWMTAYEYLDFKEPNTPDGELPRQFTELADRIENRVKQGQRFEDTDKLPTKEEVCDWLREMDRLCAEQAEATSMKSTKKSYTPEYHDFRTMLTNMKTTKDNRTVFKRD